MGNRTSKSSLPPEPTAPRDPGPFSPRAVRFVAQHQAALVMLAWVLLRALQLALMGADPTLQRYMEATDTWLAGGVAYADTFLELPPGAFVLLALPRAVALLGGYQVAFFCMMLAVDVGILFYLRRLAQSLAHPGREDGVAAHTTVCMLSYVAFTAALGAVPFQRVEMVCALLLLAWFDRVLQQRHGAGTQLLLAVACWIELSAALVLPVYLVYLYAGTRSAPFAPRRGSDWRHLGAWMARPGLKHLGVMAAITGVLYAGFFVRLLGVAAAVPGSVWDSAVASAQQLFIFLAVSSERGLHLESTYASVLLVLHNMHWLTLSADPFEEFIDVAHAATPAIDYISKILTQLAVGATCGWFGWRLLRSDAQGQRNQMLLQYALTVVLSVVFYSKIFQAEQLLLVAPLAASVALLDGPKTTPWLLGAGLIFGVGALIARFYYVDLIAFDALPSGMLLARNLLLGSLAWSLLELPTPHWAARALQTCGNVVRAPSWGYLALALAAVWMFTANLSLTTANDIWIQMRAAADMVKSGTFISHDTFSATLQGVEIVVHEWLSGFVFYGLVQFFGNGALSFLAAFAALVCFVAIYYSQEKEHRRGVHYLPLLLLTTYLVSYRVQTRPHLFTLMAQACLMLTLERWRRSGKLRDLLWLMPLQLPWINLHSGALFGPVFLLITGAAVAALVYIPGLQQGSETRPMGRRDVVHLLGMAAALALVCLVNPYGPRILHFSVDLMTNDYIRNNIWEWTTPFAANKLEYYWFWLYIIELVLLWICVLARRRTAPVVDLVWALMGTCLSMNAVRFIPDLAIFAFPVISRALTVLATVSLAPRRRAQLAWLDLAVVSVLLAQTYTYGYAHSREEHRKLLSWGFGGDMPYQQVQIMKKMHLKGVIYSEYTDASLIIHELAPDVRPVIDSRIDLYPIEEVLSYTLAGTDPEMFRRYVRTRHINLVSMEFSEAHRKVFEVLAADPDWELLATVDARVLYRRHATPRNVAED